jgi:hypothetical protein
MRIGCGSFVAAGQRVSERRETIVEDRQVVKLHCGKRWHARVSRPSDGGFPGEIDYNYGYAGWLESGSVQIRHLAPTLWI